MIDTSTPATSDAERGAAPGAPVFLVAARFRETLRRVITASGRAVSWTRRPQDAAASFDTSAANIAIVDTRGNTAAGLEAARSLSVLVEQRGGALIVLASRADPAMLDDLLASGATHLVIGGRASAKLIATIALAERFVRRLRARENLGAVASAQATRAGGAHWEWRRGATHIDISPGLAEMLGETAGRSRLPLDAALARLDPAERDPVLRALARLGRDGGSGEIGHRMVIDGRARAVTQRARAHHGPSGRLTRITALVEDLDAALADRRLAAHFDPLTGLANAAFARDWLEQAVSASGEYDPACILLLLSLTRFDGINAAYGRKLADGLLQAVAGRLRRGVGAYRPDTKLLARMGGAEFVVALAGPVRLADATVLARRLAVAFDRPFIVDGRSIHLACRIGIAVGEPGGGGADALMRAASAALSHAKAGEPNSFEVFADTDAGDLSARSASLADDLRTTIERDGFDLLYQPQVDIATDRIVGVEALIRWRHPALGLLPAEALMQVAERAEIGPLLSHHILDKALAEAVRWPDALRGLRLAVNVTADDLATIDFADRVEAAVARSEFPRALLTIEVTESGLVRDVAHAARMLDQLRARGIRVAIDDFGTGYSSLAYLSALPIDYIKLDRALVADLFGSARDRVVVRGVVDIARSLDLTVIAEGVETQAQRAAAAEAGCQLYQGFLCARPLGAPALAGLLREWRPQTGAAS